MRKFHLLFLAASTAVLFLVSPFCALGNTSSVVLTTQDSGTKVTLLDTYFLSIEKGWAVGERGTVLQTEDGGATWELVARQTAVLLISLFFSGDKHGWIIGKNGTVLYSHDGGEKWSPQISGTTASLYGIYFLNKNEGWIVGERGTILHTKDGGETWVDQASGHGPRAARGRGGHGPSLLL